MEFEEFPKIPRLKTRVIVSEKIDGTNAQIGIEGPWPADKAGVNAGNPKLLTTVGHEGMLYDVFAGSRNRWVTADDDNFGFAKWVLRNAPALVAGLGPGRHYGEWWGLGIQRGYNQEEKRFSLFNSLRWNPGNPNRPECCGVVPILFDGENPNVDDIMGQLHKHGSAAAPGFMKPEGIVMYYTGAKDRGLFKETFEHPNGKWSTNVSQTVA